MGSLRQSESCSLNGSGVCGRNGCDTAARADSVSRVALALVILLSTGCGYHTAGKANLLPSDLRILAVPALVNQTQTYKIEQMLTAAVIQELSTRTNYRVIAHPDSADPVLHGNVLTLSTTSLT